MKPATLDKLRELVEAAKPANRIIPAPAEPKDVYYVQQADGKLERVKAAQQPFHHAAASLETLVHWTATLEAESSDPATPEIWYSRVRVVGGLMPANAATDRANLAITPSPQLAYLVKNEGAKGDTFTQRDLIRLLRTTLAGCWSGDLLDAVRKVRIDKAKAVDSQQTKGKVSMNRSDVAELTGATALPEEVVFDVPIFAAGSLRARATLRAAFEVDPETERFSLIVLPGETEEAFTRGETWLAATIAELLGEHAGKIPVYHGEP